MHDGDSLMKSVSSRNVLVATGRKLNVHKRFRRLPGRLLNVLHTFNLHPVSMGIPRNMEKEAERAF